MTDYPSIRSRASGHRQSPRRRTQGLRVKARLSERHAGGDEDAGGGQQGEDDAAEPVVTPIEARWPRTMASSCSPTLRTLPSPEPVCFANLADIGLDAVLQAEVAVLGAIIARVGVQLGDGGADDLGQVQKMPEQARVMDVGGRGNDAQRQAVGRDDDMVFGPGLAAVGGIGAGQLAAVLGADRTTVDHHVPGRGLGSRAHHPDQSTMNPAQQSRGSPIVQATAQGGAASTPGRGSQFAPLHTLTDKEPQRLDDLDRRHGRSSRAERSALDLVDDPRHQRCRLRPHVRLPVPKARETDTRSAGCQRADDNPTRVLETAPKS